MIFYGTKATTLKTGQVRNVKCPDCETETTMNYSVFGKYAHVYWIPFFPITRIAILECNHCKKTFEYKNLPESIQNKLQREKQHNPIKTPIWMFTGIFLVTGLVAYIFYDNAQTDEKEAVFIKNPKKGDIYYMNSKQGFYTSTRVDEVSKDSVFLTHNNYEINQTTGMDDIDKPENYTTEKEVYSKKDLIALYQKEEIFEINRK